MKLKERPTPLTDKAESLAENYDGSMNMVVDSDFARQLERMCAELAFALENHMFMTRPRDESKEALARYGEMKGAGK